MKIVVLAGGTKHNLWPLANQSRADQFVPFLEHPANGRESMTQRIWRQLEAADLQDDAYFSAGLEQAELLGKQLGYSAPLIKEPVQRGTYSAVGLAAAYFHSIAGLSMNETVVVIPANIYIKQDFFDCIRSLPKLLRSSNADLMLIGVKPPAQGYGSSKAMIVAESRGEDSDFYSRVVAYKDKPTESEARRMAGAGALLHSGAFAFRLGYMIDKLMEEGLPVHYEELFKCYAELEVKGCQDYIGSAKEASLIEYNGFWNELSTWGDAASFIPHESGLYSGNTASGAQMLMLNELGLPVSVQGRDDLFIAASREGVLVANLNAIDHEQAASAALECSGSLPMFSEKRWGTMEVLSHSRYEDGHRSTVRLMRMKAGENLDYELHLHREEQWTILNGEAELVMDEVYSHLKTGDCVTIPSRTRHSMRALTELEWIEVQFSQDQLEENDEIKISSVWEQFG